MTLSQEFPTRVKQTTSPVLETQQAESTNKHAEYNNNQTHNPVPWPWPNITHSRTYLPTLQSVISIIQRQLYNLIHRLNNKYIVTKQVLISFFKEHIKCDS